MDKATEYLLLLHTTRHSSVISRRDGLSLRLSRHESLVLLTALVSQSWCLLEPPSWDLPFIEFVKFEVGSTVSLQYVSSALRRM